MKLRRKIKRSTKQYFIVAVICIIVIGSAAIVTSIIFMEQIRQEYKTLLSKAYSELDMNRREVYVASSDILAGDYITTDNVERKSIYSSQLPETYMEETEMGMVALVDISEGTHIVKNMLADSTISEELRELEYEVINISSNIANNDTVDVRIFYPNGESYVVLSKKVIRGFMPESVYCCLWLEEAEILRMSAAIVDAALYPGASLFMTKYIEPSIQEASVVTYTPSLAILNRLENDPNILIHCSQQLNREVRKALENRLAESMGMDISKIQWEVDSDMITANPIESDTSTSDNTTITPPIEDNQIESEGEKLTEEHELGAGLEYFLYAEEVRTKECDIEYGE